MSGDDDSRTQVREIWDEYEVRAGGSTNRE